MVEALEQFPPDVQMAMAASDMADYQKVLTEESSGRIETLIAPVRKEGVKLFEQNRLLLEKLEESYLYIVQLQKTIVELQKTTAELENTLQDHFDIER